MIGILPAAGDAKRLYGLPKYLLPIEKTFLMKWHCDLMLDAGCDLVAIGHQPNNRLIEQYLPYDRKAFIPVRQYGTMNQTLLSVYDWLAYAGMYEDPIMFGMPDTYFSDTNVYSDLSAVIQRPDVDVAVALWQAREGQRNGGMCRVENGLLVEVVDKPIKTDLTLIWGAMAWKPAFWKCIDPDEPHVGYALARAIKRGLHVVPTTASETYWDCGTSEDYFTCIQETQGQHEAAR